MNMVHKHTGKTPMCIKLKCKITPSSFILRKEMPILFEQLYLGDVLLQQLNLYSNIVSNKKYKVAQAVLCDIIKMCSLSVKTDYC